MTQNLLNLMYMQVIAQNNTKPNKALKSSQALCFTRTNLPNVIYFKQLSFQSEGKIDHSCEKLKSSLYYNKDLA